jgi:hypothetical protein
LVFIGTNAASFGSARAAFFQRAANATRASLTVLIFPPTLTPPESRYEESKTTFQRPGTAELFGNVWQPFRSRFCLRVGDVRPPRKFTRLDWQRFSPLLLLGTPVLSPIPKQLAARQ